MRPLQVSSKLAWVLYLVRSATVTTILISTPICSCLFAQEPVAKKIGPASQDPANPIAKLFGPERLDLWSLRPISNRPIPDLRIPNQMASVDAASPAEHTCQHPIDRFLLTENSTVSKEQLLQRLTLDLIGLRATYDQTFAVLQEDSPQAIDKQVDLLLADPRFGEQWARFWLDTVRYSDSNGFDWDEYRKEAWRYRDFVVRALNNDMPYDQFVLWQLAGDELLDGPPTSQEQLDQLIATGYLRLGPFDNAAKLFNEQDRARSEVLTDLTETTGAAFLGLTLSCCRCHHHKTDPLSHQDHYRFRAFFAATQFDESTPILLEQDRRTIEEHNLQIDAMIAPIRALIDSKEKQNAEDSKTQEPKETFQNQIKELNGKIDALASNKRKLLTGLLATDNAQQMDKIYVLEQGNHQKPLEEVEPGFPSVLFPNTPEITAPAHGKTTGRRLALARWIASNENPWTARVIVNRVWLNLFGEGLVATPNDFGVTGSAPVSQDLLDHLAAYLVEHDWSIKSLIRYIVSSRAYASQIGPTRKLRRLSAEQMRDVVLQVTGQLQHRNGGPPVWPPVSPDVLQANPAVLDDNETKTKGWYPSPASDQSVRSLYLIQKRTIRLPWMETFDLPENTVSCARRDVSIVPSQALALLNADWVWQSAYSLAQENQLDIHSLFRTVLSREPSQHEQTICRSYLDSGRSIQELALVLINSSELAFIP